MTSVTSQTRKSNMNSWTGLLANPQISLKKSIEFIKRLTVIAVSNITYLRNIFPESAFIDRQLEGLNLKILKGDHLVPGAQQMINWLKSAFEAVNLQYLRKLILTIESEKGGSTLETYTFSFSYNDENIKCELENEMNHSSLSLQLQNSDPPEDIKRSTQMMLRTLLTITQTFEMLPDNAEITMRLVYYDDVTPTDYQPKYFKSANALDLKFPLEPSVHKLGTVTSKYHSLDLTLKTSYSTSTDANEVVNETNTADDEDVIQSSQTSNISQKNMSMTPDGENNAETGSNNLIEKLSDINFASMNCVCGVNEDGSEALISCTLCATNQHMACYKLLEGQKVENHVCISCWKTKKPLQCSIDKELTQLPENKQKLLALYRRALVYCLNTWRVSSKSIALELGVSNQLADGIFERLNKDRALKPSKGRGVLRTVDRDFLHDSILPQFFGIQENSDSGNDTDTELFENVDKNEELSAKVLRPKKQKVSRTESALISI